MRLSSQLFNCKPEYSRPDYNWKGTQTAVFGKINPSQCGSHPDLYPKTLGITLKEYPCSTAFFSRRAGAESRLKLESSKTRQPFFFTWHQRNVSMTSLTYNHSDQYFTSTLLSTCMFAFCKYACHKAVPFQLTRWLFFDLWCLCRLDLPRTNFQIIQISGQVLLATRTGSRGPLYAQSCQDSCLTTFFMTGLYATCS